MRKFIDLRRKEEEVFIFCDGGKRKMRRNKFGFAQDCAVAFGAHGAKHACYDLSARYAGGILLEILLSSCSRP